MTINEGELRKQFTQAMAKAVDEADLYDAYFGEPSENMDFGVARADGVMPADLLFMWDFAGQIVDLISLHGMDVADIAEKACALFFAYRELKGGKTDFSSSDMDQMLKATVDKLNDQLKEG